MCQGALATEYPKSITVARAVIPTAMARALILSSRKPMMSVPTIEISDASEVPVLYSPIVMPKSPTICAWKSDMQFTKAV